MHHASDHALQSISHGKMGRLFILHLSNDFKFSHRKMTKDTLISGQEAPKQPIY